MQPAGTSLVRHASLLSLLAGLVVLLVVPLVRALARTEGLLICALDDPFIHMAIAKNLVENGVWGVSPGEFSSSSSSPLWTLLLSAWFVVGGIQQSAPILLNFALALVLCLACRRLFQREAPTASPLYVLLATLAVLVLTPLSALVFSGQEHVLQVLLTLFLVVFATRLLTREPDAEQGTELRWLLVLVPIYTATRFEGAALVAGICALFLLRGRWRLSILLALLAFLPIGAYGAYSLSQGAFFLPNSVLLKIPGAQPGTPGTVLDLLGGTAIEQLWRTKHLLVLVVASAFLFAVRFRRAGFWESRQLMALLFLFATAAHMQFGKTGWFYRYEAYLVALGVFQLALVVREVMHPVEPRRLRLSGALLLLVLLVLGYQFVLPRAVRSFRQVPRASANIFEQQIQTGRFLRSYYAGSTVALNDIGAPTFLGDFRCLDLVGLANSDVAVEMRAGTYDTASIERIAREGGASIAIVYESWFEHFGGLPAGWVRAGKWRIPDNLVCGSDTVSIFAVEPAALDPLLANLKEFDSRLPQRVSRSGKYLEP